MKNIQDNFISGIGNTPLIKLRAASEITGCNIYGKAEFMNPGGSVKDRAALALIRDAEDKKLISKGGTIVEGTAGNTGIGLCLLGNSLGYKTIIVMNDNQTQEKKDLLRNIGADLRLVPAKPYKDDANFVKVAAKLADELRPSNNNGVVWANQFDNVANAKVGANAVVTKDVSENAVMVGIPAKNVGTATEEFKPYAVEEVDKNTSS